MWAFTENRQENDLRKAQQMSEIERMNCAKSTIIHEIIGNYVHLVKQGIVCYNVRRWGTPTDQKHEEIHKGDCQNECLCGTRDRVCEEETC